MRFVIMLGAAVFAVAISGSAMRAQGLKTAAAPAELPPSSYTGMQYVDSKGCVWIRAGSGVSVTWIPRVSRERVQICNAQPTAVARTAPTSVAKPAPAPVKLVPAPVPVVTTPTPVIAAKPAPKTVAIIPAPSPVAKTVTQAPVAQKTSACTNRSALSQRYTNYGQHGPVRCGPQAEPPVGTVIRTAPSGPKTTGKKIGTGVFEPVSANPVMPDGYRPVWTDDRLNLHRPQPAQPKSLHVLQWTDYAPYRLIDTTTGKDVTAAYPQLRYPYTDHALQQAHLRARRTVSPKTQPAARPVYTPLPNVAPVTDPASPARMSSKTDPVGTKVAVKVGKGHKHVQAGAFTDPAARDQAIAALRSAGLPAIPAMLKRSDKTLHLALVGPYGSAQTLAQALLQVRNAGFGGATTR